jgi:hypothetical protein
MVLITNTLCLFTAYLSCLSTFTSFMPKLIDYPRTSYTGAWEVAEVVDDTGGKCALETCARKLNRKVSGSFKAIVGSGVKFGLLTSKREILTTTTLFRRIKHAYDKQEELLFHREAFLTPPLFTQLCRKFRSRELPVAMLDVLLIREFGVEEINAQSVAKAFIDGARMVGVLDENNIVADIDQLAAQQAPRRELASPPPAGNIFRQSPTPTVPTPDSAEEEESNSLITDTSEASDTSKPREDTLDAQKTPDSPLGTFTGTPPRATSATTRSPLPPSRPAPAATTDAIAHLFGLNPGITTASALPVPAASTRMAPVEAPPRPEPVAPVVAPAVTPTAADTPLIQGAFFRIQLVGPGLNTQLDIVDADDLTLVRALLDKIERRFTQ